MLLDGEFASESEAKRRHSVTIHSLVAITMGLLSVPTVEDIERRFPMKPRRIRMRLPADDSLVDI
jgi:hypothetical protein